MNDWLKALIRVEISRYTLWITMMPLHEGKEGIERLQWLSRKFRSLYDQAWKEVMNDSPLRYYEISSKTRRDIKKVKSLS
jgi:hypothetical protein